MIPDDDELVAWARSLPPDVTEDTLWRTPAYRLALFLSDQAMDDVRYLVRDIRTRGHIPQLLDAVGSISANLAEGYGRSSGRERAHFYEYACCSAREGRDWYVKCRRALPDALLSARLARLTRVVKILTAIIPRERDRAPRRRRRGEDDAHQR